MIICLYMYMYTCLWTFSSLSSSHFRCLYLISLTFVCTHFLGIKSFFFSVSLPSNQEKIVCMWGRWVNSTQVKKKKKNVGNIEQLMSLFYARLCINMKLRKQTKLKLMTMMMMVFMEAVNRLNFLK